MSNEIEIKNTIILKNGPSAPSTSTLQKAELGFDTAHEVLFIGRGSDSDSEPLNPIPLSPCFSPEAPTGLNVENLLWVDTSDSSGVIPIEMGGTGANTAALALENLGALPLSGGTVTGNIVIDTSGAEKGIRIKNDSGTYVHNSVLYGGNADSSTALGCWDTKNDRRIWAYEDENNCLILGHDNTKIVVHSGVYGDRDTIPASGKEGQIFFVKAE